MLSRFNLSWLIKQSPTSIASIEVTGMRYMLLAFLLPLLFFTLFHLPPSCCSPVLSAIAFSDHWIPTQLACSANDGLIRATCTNWTCILHF